MGTTRPRLRLALRWTGCVALFVVVAAAFWALVWTYYNPRVELDPPHVVKRSPRGGDITVLLGGDFAPTDRAMPWIERYGYRYPYLRTAGLIRQADVSFGNLEAPVTRSPHRFPFYKHYFYRVWPEAVSAWRWLGLDVVSLANNHMKDRRSRGLLDTVRYLDGARIAHVGAGATEAAARRPVIFQVGETRIGFLAYLQDWWFYNLYLDIFALRGRPGCARFVPADVAEDIKRLRPRVDVLIVSMHWGGNYAPVTAEQERAARQLAALGVDVVAGHHNHDVQPAEAMGGTLVLYSLGNYAWGAIGRASMKIGLLARVRIAPRRKDAPARIRTVSLIPICTQNRIVRYQPRPLRPRERVWAHPFLEATRRRGLEAHWEDGTVRLGWPRRDPLSGRRAGRPAR